MHRLRHIATLSILLFAASHSAAAQETYQRFPVDQDARQTREQLNRILQQYPPSLSLVLQLDPTLLTNTKYLELYPRLAAFLAQHPEIVHNPAYFFGNRAAGLQQDLLRDGIFFRPEMDVQTDRRNVLLQRLLEGLTIFFSVAFVTIVLGWLVKTVIDHRRWLRVSRVQTEAHSKLLDRFTSNEDLLAYIQTPAGRRFLDAPLTAFPPGPAAPAPLGRILWSVQIGLVLVMAGIGLQFVSYRLTDDVSQVFFVLGVLAISLGVGFGFSALVSFLLSRRMGLLDQPASGIAGGGPGQPPPS